MRAKLICERLFDALGEVLRLEEVYDTAEFLAEVVEPGQPFPDVDTFLPDRPKGTILEYAGRRRHRRKDLIRMGYPLPPGGRG